MDSEFDVKDRRRCIRVPVGIMICVQSEKDAELFTTNYSGDLSLGGMFIKTFTPKPIGTKVNIQLPSQEPPGYVEIYGEVVNHQELTSSGVKTGMGVRFVRMDSNARFALQQFINGNWHMLFDKPTLPNEIEAFRAISSIIDFLAAAIDFPMGGF